MKNTKKFAAMIAALALSACSVAPLAMGMTASAAENTITFAGEKAGTHSYSVYKIFAGEAEANGMNTAAGAKLNNLEWAVSEDVQKALVEKLQANDAFVEEGTNAFAAFDTTTAPSVADFAAVVAGFEANSAKAKAFAETVVKVFRANSVPTAATGDSDDGISLATDGYYVIAETGVEGVGTDEYTGMTTYLLGVYDASAGAEVTVKSDVPSFQKKLKDTNDSTGVTTDWQDSADYDIGDDVPFQLKATLPSNYADYKAYKLTFHDNFRTVDGKEVFDFNEITALYVDANNNGVYDDGDVDIKAKYFKAYSSVVGYDFDVVIDNLKSDYAPSALSVNGAAVIVEYTAKLNDNAAIGSAGNWNDAYLTYTTNPNWSGSGTPEEGDEEEEKPKDSPVDTTVVFTYQTVINKVNPQGEKLPGATFTLEKELADGTWKTIAQVETGDTPTFTFKGLDDGKYKLTEDEAPTNYKTATKPVYFTISADHTNDPETLELTSLSGAGTDGVTENGFINLVQEKMVSTIEDGKIEADFINTSGAELPSTGGMGTKLFYLGGGAMVAVAGIFLITKKRAGKSEN